MNTDELLSEQRDRPRTAIFKAEPLKEPAQNYAEEKTVTDILLSSRPNPDSVSVPHTALL